MKISIFALLCCLGLCSAGTLGHETAVYCDFGCILAELPDKDEGVICSERQYIKISPDPTDGWYRIKLYSGYPLGHANDKKTIPLYAQDYAWWEDYGRVSLDGANCLTVSPAMFFAVDIIGQCPPSNFDTSKEPNDGLRTNPYWFFFGPGQSYTKSPSLDDNNNDEGSSFDSADLNASNSGTVLGLETGVAPGLDDPPVLSLLDSGNSIFDLSDSNTPFLLSSDGGSINKNNLKPLDNMDFTDSNSVFTHLDGGHPEDYSIFA